MCDQSIMLAWILCFYSIIFWCKIKKYMSLISRKIFQFVVWQCHRKFFERIPWQAFVTNVVIFLGGKKYCTYHNNFQLFRNSNTTVSKNILICNQILAQIQISWNSFLGVYKINCFTIMSAFYHHSSWTQNRLSSD